ncbi:MAG: hypothetical protein ACOYMW_08040 [Candidatus Competibacteraceae bacterium]
MKFFEHLLYLDRDFISAMFEDETGYSPETKITKTEGMNASARIPIFSAGASSVESKSYSVSTVGMLAKLEEQLSKFPDFSPDKYNFGNSSLICWIRGKLTIEKLEIKRKNHVETSKSDKDNKERIVAEESYYAINSENSKFALVPTPDYFTSGVASFQKLSGTVVGPIELPVKALIRVYSAQTSFQQWIAVPIVILEP